MEFHYHSSESYTFYPTFSYHLLNLTSSLYIGQIRTRCLPLSSLSIEVIVDKHKLLKCEIAKKVLVLFLLVFIPFVSTSLRPSYLYFILNILVIALGTEAKIIENFSDPHHEKNPVSVVASHSNTDQIVHDATSSSDAKQSIQDSVVQVIKPENQLIEVSSVPTKVAKPSVFFIISSGLDEVQEEEEKRDQELFIKAETFIANFYKQLKMQREES